MISSKFTIRIPLATPENPSRALYTAWGEKNSNKSHAEKLGVLLNDDKGQRRWALNFSDPRALKEIDSVFVTLERVGTEDERPKGKRMLTAYLDSRVNHP